MNYREQMFDSISQIIEDSGKGDEAYDNFQKATDILEILESLLAYTIFTTCMTTDQVRDVCEESYMNIKRQTLKMMYQHLDDQNKKGSLQ